MDAPDPADTRTTARGIGTYVNFEPPTGPAASGGTAARGDEVEDFTLPALCNVIFEDGFASRATPAPGARRSGDPALSAGPTGRPGPRIRPLNKSRRGDGYVSRSRGR